MGGDENGRCWRWGHCAASPQQNEFCMKNNSASTQTPRKIHACKYLYLPYWPDCSFSQFTLMKRSVLVQKWCWQAHGDSKCQPVRKTNPNSLRVESWAAPKPGCSVSPPSHSSLYLPAFMVRSLKKQNKTSKNSLCFPLPASRQPGLVEQGRSELPLPHGDGCHPWHIFSWFQMEWKDVFQATEQQYADLA